MGVVGQVFVVNPDFGIGDALPDECDGEVGVSEVGVHHVGEGGVFLSLAVDDDAEQGAASLALVFVEHLHGEEVVGGGADVGVEDDEGVPFCSLEEVASSEQLASMPAQRMVSKSKRFFFK